ncbi:MAG: hypothetical protein OEZ58_21035 [Gammaproteobacteria bacterium]|nr:hypothetical protein [Gammaproteobacteria bacterium]
MNAKFESVFKNLCHILQPYKAILKIKCDEANKLYLDTQHVMKNKQALFFAGVEINKNYVSYHLMPVYVNPSLLDDISPNLRQRMQGKSCFNFKTVDSDLFEELITLTQAGFKDYQKQGYVHTEIKD